MDAAGFDFENSVDFGCSVIAFAEFLAVARFAIDGAVEIFDVVMEFESFGSAFADKFAGAGNERMFWLLNMQAAGGFSDGSVGFDVLDPEEGVGIFVDGVVDVGAFQVDHF